MENYSNNTTSEQISMLLDGELDAMQEDQLFRDIADNPEYQREMQQNISIKEAVKKDTEAFSPPADLTSSLFDKLGYANPYGAPKAMPWANFFRKTAAPALVGLLAITSTALIVNNLKSDDNIQLKKVVPIVTSIEDTKSKDNLVSDNAENVTEMNIVSNSDGSNINVKDDNEITSSDNLTNSQTAVVPNQEDKTEDLANPANKNVNIKDNVNDENEINVPNIIFPSANINACLSMNDNTASSMFDSYGRYKVNYPTNDVNNWSLGLRGTLAPTMNMSNELNANTNNFNTFIAGIYRNTSENFQLGIEFGNETFNRYSTDVTDQRIVTNDQVRWFGFAARHNMNYLTFSEIAPFAQVTMGSGTGGQIGRLMVGFDRELFNNFNLNVSYEAGLFFYSVQNVSYTSNKHGLTLGLNYKF